MPAAILRPSAMAQTMSDAPRLVSPPPMTTTRVRCKGSDTFVSHGRSTDCGTDPLDLAAGYSPREAGIGGHGIGSLSRQDRVGADG